MSLSLDQKLKMINLHEEGVLKVEMGQKLGLLSQMICQSLKAKEKFLKEINTLVNTWMIKKWSSFIANMEKVLLIRIEDKNSHNIPLSQSLMQSIKRWDWMPWS